MDKSLIERYKQEMLKMYENRIQTTNTMVDNVVAPPITQNSRPLNNNDADTGILQGVATQVSGLYFVPNAKVTVFTGTPENMQIIDTSFTDQNGKTKEFVLSTPPKSLSIDSENTQIPYSLYNMMFEADGFLTNIHLNIPVFPSVTSRQTSNLLLLETAGVDKGPRIFDELQSYNL